MLRCLCVRTLCSCTESFSKRFHNAAIEFLPGAGHNLVLSLIRRHRLGAITASQSLVGIRHKQNVSLDWNVDRSRSLLPYDLLGNDYRNHAPQEISRRLSSNICFAAFSEAGDDFFKITAKTWSQTTDHQYRLSPQMSCRQSYAIH